MFYVYKGSSIRDVRTKLTPPLVRRTSAFEEPLLGRLLWTPPNYYFFTFFFFFFFFFFCFSDVPMSSSAPELSREDTSLGKVGYRHQNFMLCWLNTYVVTCNYITLAVRENFQSAWCIMVSASASQSENLDSILFLTPTKDCNNWYSQLISA